MKKLVVFILCAISISCAPAVTKPAGQYRMAGIVAGVEIRVYQTRRDFLAGVPAHVAAFSESIERVSPGHGVAAFYDWNTKIIHIQEGDTMALVHEFKHHIDAPWVHGFTSTPEDQGWRQVGLDKVFTLRGREFSVRDGETLDSIMARLKKLFD